jgi:hypothetical protein
MLFIDLRIPFDKTGRNQLYVVKLNCTFVLALMHCTGLTAHRGSTGIVLPFPDHVTRRGWGASVTTQLLFTPGKNPVPTAHEAGWVPGPVWTGVEDLAPTGIRSLDRPAHSQLLYQLHYLAHIYMWNTVKNNKAHKYYINDNTPQVFTANNGSRNFLIYRQE